MVGLLRHFRRVITMQVFLFITEFLVIEGILASATVLYSKGSRFESRWELGKFSDRIPLILHVSSATPDVVSSRKNSTGVKK